MHEAEKLSVEAIRGFMEASEYLRFASESREQVYGWVELVLSEQEYRQQSKTARGLLKLTGKE